MAERPRDRRLVLERHRQVRLIPVAEDAEPLELVGHDADEPLGVGPAGAAEIRRAELPLLRPQLAVDLQLDRQAVTVVAGHVRRVEARHRPRLDDEVLEDLVEGRAQVNLPVGVGRTVVKDVLRPARPRLANPRVQAHFLPSGQRLRLGGRQVGLHREVGPGQIERILPIGHGYPDILDRRLGLGDVRHAVRAGRPRYSADATHRQA